MEVTDNKSDQQAAEPNEVGDQRVVFVMPSDAMIGPEAKGIDLAELWNVIWQSKWLIAGITAMFAFAGVAYALLASEWYRAEVLLMPSEKRSMPDLVGSLGGLASLVGISVGGSGTAESIAVLKSREFTEDFIEDLGLTTVLLADRWDSDKNEWKGGDPKKWPDMRDAVKYFDEHVLRVAEDKKTGLVRLSVDWKDPQVAADWTNILVQRLNFRMQQRALAEAEGNVRYLRTEISETNVVSLQQSIGRVLESEMQKLMLARGNEEFAFRVLDPARAPKLRVWPKRMLIVVLATFLGAITSLLVVAARRAWRVRRPPIMTGAG